VGGWGSWYSLGGWLPQGTEVAAVSKNPGQIDLFAVGADGAVWGDWYAGGWGTWYSLGG
jgi:hypothetical protein